MRPMPPESLLGDGFIARPWRVSDVPALTATIRSSLAHLQPWMPWAQRAPDEAHMEEQVRRFVSNRLLDTDFVLGILGPDDHTVLGGSGFHPRGGALGPGTAEVGLWIAADAAGKGLGTSVATAMVQWGLTEWWWKRLEWRCDPTNAASVAVAEKVGLTLEGTLRGNTVRVDGSRRDTVVYARLRDR